MIFYDLAFGGAEIALRRRVRLAEIPLARQVPSRGTLLARHWFLAGTASLGPAGLGLPGCQRRLGLADLGDAALPAAELLRHLLAARCGAAELVLGRAGRLGALDPLLNLGFQPGLFLPRERWQLMALCLEALALTFVPSSTVAASFNQPVGWASRMMSMNSDSGPMNEHRYWPLSWSLNASVRPAWMTTSLSCASPVSLYQR